jgi:hypothetical protein
MSPANFDGYWSNEVCKSTSNPQFVRPSLTASNSIDEDSSNSEILKEIPRKNKAEEKLERMKDLLQETGIEVAVSEHNENIHFLQILQRKLKVK